MPLKWGVLGMSYSKEASGQREFISVGSLGDDSLSVQMKKRWLG